MIVYEAENMFLLREWSVFAIISNSDVSCTSLLLVYLVISPKKRLWGAFCNIFFICVLMSKGRPVRVFTGNQLFLRGREVKVTVFLIVHIVWVWFWVDRRQAKSKWEFILHSLNCTDRSMIHPKLKSKLGVECRKTLDSTARPRRQTLFAWCF